MIFGPFLMDFGFEPMDIGLMAGIPAFLFWLSFIGFLSYFFVRKGKLERKQIVLLSLVLFFFLLTYMVNITSLYETLYL